MVKVVVPRENGKVVLASQRRNPHVVLGDGPSLLAQLFPHSRVVTRGFDLDRKNDGVMNQEVEKTTEPATIARPGKTVSIFSDHD
ncbi:MAG TPA: hypothetical protein VGQ36_08285 [Thermoanaerobaculia bacterium]|jgi:hypothetical protein|nr:hypothetical protein [Thermoanaerobaculia bacterium]